MRLLTTNARLIAFFFDFESLRAMRRRRRLYRKNSWYSHGIYPSCGTSPPVGFVVAASRSCLRPSVHARKCLTRSRCVQHYNISLLNVHDL